MADTKYALTRTGIRYGGQRMGEIATAEADYRKQNLSARLWSWGITIVEALAVVSLLVAILIGLCVALFLQNN